MELIVTHSNTDFDGLAAQLAAQKLYPHALPMLNPRLRDNVAEFEALYCEHLPFLHEDDLPDEPVTRLIVVDMPTPPSLPGLDDERIPTLIIDHHPRDNEPLPHEDLIHAEVGAITSLLVERLIAAGITLSSVEATLMLLGIYEDTGSLSYPSTRQVDVASAAWLLGQGARIEALSEFLRRPLTAEQERVFRQLEADVRLEQIAGWTVLLASAQVEGDAPQLSALAEKLRDLYSPAVTALAIATGDHGTQIILRANPDALDVGALARRFGGGGHAAAAAAYARGRGAGELLPELEAAIRRDIRPAMSAAEIMTRWVHTVPMSATVGEAYALLTRSGHGALPAVDDERVVHGLAMRHDLSTAMRHGRTDAPLKRYMWDDPPMIAPDTPVAALRQTLLEDDETRSGRLLVVDAQQRLQGIITRADLLRTLHPNADRAAETMSDELEGFLDPQLLALLHQAAELAEDRGAALYVVGGTVRDMLLNRPQGDLDLLVEGDAIGLARALADRIGGTVRSYGQFGTATLELTSGASGGTQHSAPSLDFVMARTEFYESAAALPEVEASSLRHDLHRRDFTINTLAVCLNPSRYGRLYDFYGGKRDLERRLVRVLHNLSFLDDPTRIIRAARLAARLSFMIEPRTRALIDDALEYEMLRRTSPQRIFNELRLVLREDQPERVLALLDELGVLRALHPALSWRAEQAAQFQAARTSAADVDRGQVFLALIVYPLQSNDRAEIARHYQPPTALARLFQDIDAIQRQLPQLRAATLPDSTLDLLLHGIGAEALHAARIAEGGLVAKRIARYLAELRHAKTELNGDDLRQLGVAPGPQLGRLLAGLRAAKLDGQVQTRADEIAWVQQQVYATK